MTCTLHDVVLGKTCLLAVLLRHQQQLECGPMPNVMATLPNIGGALFSTPQSLADARCWSWRAVQ